jgi:hypothetical protein
MGAVNSKGDLTTISHIKTVLPQMLTPVFDLTSKGHKLE